VLLLNKERKKEQKKFLQLKKNLAAESKDKKEREKKK
jgi:hypothetical protein